MTIEEDDKDERCVNDQNINAKFFLVSEYVRHIQIR